MIHKADLTEACNGMSGPFCLVARTDGVSQNFMTKESYPSNDGILQFENPARLILNLPTLQNSVFQMSLLTLRGNRTTVVGSAQIFLRDIPDSPRKISFPLMSVNNVSQKVCTVRMKVAITLFQQNEQQQMQNRQPQPTGFQYNNPQYHPPQTYQHQQQFYQPGSNAYSIPGNPYNSMNGQSNQMGQPQYPPFQPLQQGYFNNMLNPQSTPRPNNDRIYTRRYNNE